MRVIFIQPTEYEFRKLLSSNNVLKNSNGGALSDIKIFTPTPRRRGGGFFTDIGRKIIPFLVKSVTPAAREFGSSVVKDLLINNKSLKDSVKHRGVAALKRVGRNMVGDSGGVLKSVKRNGRSKIKKKRKNAIKDVYTLI